MIKRNYSTEATKLPALLHSEALRILNETDPIEITEYEYSDGTLAYSVEGCISSGAELWSLAHLEDVLLNLGGE